MRQLHKRLGIGSAFLLLTLALLVGCTATEDPDVAAAERELANYQEPTGAAWVPKSADELISTVTYVFIGKVNKVGPTFNGIRLGDRAQLGPDPESYSLAQGYEVQVERYLMGAGPSTILVSQGEGRLPGGMKPTEARLKAARKKTEYTPISIGSRYLFLTAFAVPLTELGRVDVYPLAGPPARFLLKDGKASSEGVKKRDKSAIDKLFPSSSEEALVKRFEKAIADSKK